MTLIILMWKNWLEIVHRIHKNCVQNLQVMCTEFSTLLHRILTTLVKAVSHSVQQYV